MSLPPFVQILRNTVKIQCDVSREEAVLVNVSLKYVRSFLLIPLGRMRLAGTYSSAAAVLEI